MLNIQKCCDKLGDDYMLCLAIHLAVAKEYTPKLRE